MSIYASSIVKQAEAWLGRKESNGTHKLIIDTYNAHKPLARGYKVKYTDAWCATFVSAVAIKCGATGIIPTECGCDRQIELFKQLGAWIENENRVPEAGEIIFYDWEDSGSGDNKGGANHVGIVQKVVGSTIHVIEGNYNNSVAIRKLSVNGRYIRGYGKPKYDLEPVNNDLATEKQITVKEWQLAAIADGFRFPKYGADGSWGAECEEVAKKAVVKKRLVYKYRNLTKLVQKVVGADVDGKCGSATKAAIIAYQRKHNLETDGEVGLNTWRVMIDR